jgi:diguanylate cyclase (GGDEF)-like protein
MFFQLDTVTTNVTSAAFLLLAAVAVFVLRGGSSLYASMGSTAIALFCASLGVACQGLGSMNGQFKELHILSWPLMAASWVAMTHALRSSCDQKDSSGVSLITFGIASICLLALDGWTKEIAFNLFLLAAVIRWIEACSHQDVSGQHGKQIRQASIALMALMIGWILFSCMRIFANIDTGATGPSLAIVGNHSTISRLDFSFATCSGALLVVWSVQLRNRQETYRRIQLDPLTGLASRQYLLQDSERWIKDHPMSLALMVVDIDHFRSINELYGHDVGDSALKHVAKQLKASVRKDTLVARYGGEEFGLIVPITNREEASKVAERLRFEIEQSPLFLGGTPIHITVSIGVTLYDQSISLSKALIDADAKLHDAKIAGRNRVVTAYA